MPGKHLSSVILYLLQPTLSGARSMPGNAGMHCLELGTGWAEERYLQGLASLGNDPVRGCVYDSVRSSVVVQSVIDLSLIHI